jgi:hypothetical protein
MELINTWEAILNKFWQLALYQWIGSLKFPSTVSTICATGGAKIAPCQKEIVRTGGCGNTARDRILVPAYSEFKNMLEEKRKKINCEQ